MSKMRGSISKINLRLYFALMLVGLCPTVYTTVRIFFLGQLPNEWAYSIAGQLGWVGLLYEIMNEAILLPLFYFMGKVVRDRDAFADRVRSGLLMTGCIYTLFSLIIILAAEPLLCWMAADSTILAASASYIRIESVSTIFGMLSSFTLIALVTLDRERYLYILTAARLILSLLADTFLVSTLPVSFQLGVNGIGWSNIIVNGVLFMISLFLLEKEGLHLFSRSRISFGWLKELTKVGGISGLESFVRNIAFMLMIIRMVNVVGEQGVYWVANNFIWGWLLLPVTQLGELIKQEIATDRSALSVRTRGYFGITGSICLLWFVSIPLWKPFMKDILNYSDVELLFHLVLIQLIFYIMYAFQNVFDATFYALGKTNYMLFESIATNTLYYGAAYLLYRFGIWTPTLIGIALMFGFGMAFDSAVSWGAYRYLLKKEGLRSSP